LFSLLECLFLSVCVPSFQSLFLDDIETSLNFLEVFFLVLDAQMGFQDVFIVFSCLSDILEILGLDRNSLLLQLGRFLFLLGNHLLQLVDMRLDSLHLILDLLLPGLDWTALSEHIAILVMRVISLGRLLGVHDDFAVLELFHALSFVGQFL